MKPQKHNVFFENFGSYGKINLPDLCALFLMIGNTGMVLGFFFFEESLKKKI
jgi:hypothetical protein